MSILIRGNSLCEVLTWGKARAVREAIVAAGCTVWKTGGALQSWRGVGNRGGSSRLHRASEARKGAWIFI